MAGLPVLRFCNAESRSSKRNFAARWPLSGPWQGKQFLDNIGRISRLKSTVASGGAATAPNGSRKPAATQHTLQERHCFQVCVTVASPSLPPTLAALRYPARAPCQATPVPPVGGTRPFSQQTSPCAVPAPWVRAADPCRNPARTEYQRQRPLLPA